MRERSITLIEDQCKIYDGKLTSNTCYLKGEIFSDMKVYDASNGGKIVRVTIGISNGKDKEGKWKPSTYADLNAFGEQAIQLIERYGNKDQLEVIAKYEPRKNNQGSYFHGFTINSIVRLRDKIPPKVEDPDYAGNDELPF